MERLAIEPPPRVRGSRDALGELPRAARPLLRRHGYVLLEGLEDMTAHEMRALMAAIAGPGHFMLRFDDDAAYGANCVGEVPEVRVLGRGHANALLADIGYEWHQDGGGTAPFLTLLHCKEPCEGADTLFADGEVLFRRLSDADQQLARTLTAVYSNMFTAGGPTALDAASGLRMSACGTRRTRAAARRKESWALKRFQRSLITTDGVDRFLAGAKGLEHLEGMGSEESAAELSRLLRAALSPVDEAAVDGDLRTVGRTTFDPDTVYAHTWRRGEALVWDNHRMLHSTVPLCLYRADSRRLMWQVICKADPDWSTSEL